MAKKISRTEKSLRGKIYYLKSKNKKITAEVNKFSGKDEDKFINYEGKKRKIRTVKNILRNKITHNNNAYNKTFAHLEKRFKKNPKHKKKKERNGKKGLYLSPLFRAWELNIAIKWIESKAKNDSDLFDYQLQINEEVALMGNYDFFQMTYNKNDFEFSVFIIENS